MSDAWYQITYSPITWWIGYSIVAVIAVYLIAKT